MLYLNNKNASLNEEYKTNFNNNKILKIMIDNQNRSSLDTITNDDIKYSKTISMKISK